MSPQSKGRAFEVEVYELLQQEVINGSLGLNSENTRVFRNKRYYSRDRKGLVETDVALELWRSEATSPSLIWIWECKDLARPVEVTHVESLHAKLEQIGADNTKGTIISRGPLTRHAIDYAKAKGLGVARLLEGIINNVAFYTTVDESRKNQKQMWEASQSLNKNLDDILEGRWKDGSDVAVRLGVSCRTFFGYLSVGVPEVGGMLHSYLFGELANMVSSARQQQPKV
jgi:hypothetical protein